MRRAVSHVEVLRVALPRTQVNILVVYYDEGEALGGGCRLDLQR